MAGLRFISKAKQVSGQHHPAFATAEGLHPYLHADPLHQGLYVGDDPDLAAGRLQGIEA